jgi:hypothetical protein
MASFSTSAPSSTTPVYYSASGIALIVGLACLAGFTVDLAVLVLPPELSNLEWRAGVVQQFADRSIILLIGTALTLFGSLGNRRWLKNLSIMCLFTGVIFLFVSLLAIADSVSLHNKTLSTISTQSAQIQTQIESARSNPGNANLTPENLQRAEQQLKNQTRNLTSTTKKSIFKLGVASVGNLVIVGLGMISLGRYGARLRSRS